KKMVAVGGLSGAGKSRLARELAPFLPGPAGARILRSDVLRKRGLGLSAQAHAGEGAYTPAARSEVYRELVAAGLAVAGGASVILDATFQDASSREMAEAAFGPRLHPYWLEAPLETRLERVAGRAHDASDADVAVAAAQAPPADLSLRWRRLDALKPLAENCSLICADLGLPCGRG
ncbi:MAG: AAA family ATPase, partial [Hyphomonadaceae bacterium]